MIRAINLDSVVNQRETESKKEWGLERLSRQLFGGVTKHLSSSARMLTRTADNKATHIGRHTNTHFLTERVHICKPNPSSPFIYSFFLILSLNHLSRNKKIVFEITSWFLAALALTAATSAAALTAETWEAWYDLVSVVPHQQCNIKRSVNSIALWLSPCCLRIAVIWGHRTVIACGLIQRG